MDYLVFKFKSFIGFVMVLLLAQQSFAAFTPMNCNNTNKPHATMQVNNSHVTSQMHMNDSQSKVNMASSNEECDVCDSSDCRCCDFTRCLGSSLSITAQVINLDVVQFVNHGKRFISSDEYPDSGNYLHPFRPPISI